MEKNLYNSQEGLQDDTKGKWPDQLPEVIWGLNTTKTIYTWFTPFKLIYGVEAMTQQKLKFNSPIVQNNLAPETDELTTKDLLGRLQGWSR
jgi:hypothetical protein